MPLPEASGTAAPPRPLASRHWCVASELGAIDAVVEAIVGLCERTGFARRQCRLNVPVAVTEALANAVLRGNAGDATRLLRVSAVVCADRLEVEVGDDGPGFDVEAVRGSPEDGDWLEREDGRGVFLMRQLMDAVQSARTASGERHRLRLLLYRQ